jgi:hypothetical protein
MSFLWFFVVNLSLAWGSFSPHFVNITTIAPKGAIDTLAQYAIGWGEALDEVTDARSHVVYREFQSLEEFHAQILASVSEDDAVALVLPVSAFLLYQFYLRLFCDRRHRTGVRNICEQMSIHWSTLVILFHSLRCIEQWILWCGDNSVTFSIPQEFAYLPNLADRFEFDILPWLSQCNSFCFQV